MNSITSSLWQDTQMQITRFSDPLSYAAPKHFDMRGLRLQGFDASASTFAWTGLSHFLPGGGAPLDSCFILGGEARAIRNAGNAVATMLVIMPYPAGANA